MESYPVTYYILEIQTKKLIFCHKSWFPCPSFEPGCLGHFKLWIMLDQIGYSLKVQRFTPTGWVDIGIRKFEFVAKTQLLCSIKEVMVEKKIKNILILRTIYSNLTRISLIPGKIKINKLSMELLIALNSLAGKMVTYTLSKNERRHRLTVKKGAFDCF